MAVLQKLRTKFGLAISIIVALGLLSFIIDPGQIQSAMQSMSSKYDVGNIAGKAVSYNDFQQDIERYTAISELMSGTSVKSEAEQQQIRNAAWQELIDRFLFIKNAKSAGIKVGEDELVALTQSDMVSPVLASNPVFCDEAGNYDPSRLADLVQTISLDPSGNMQLYWNYIQQSLNTQQYYTKYGALLNASAYQNPLMLRKSIEENNATTDVDFVMIPYTFAEDTSIVVSDAEIKAYYDAHKKFYKQVANRDIEYVVFEVVPSQKDIDETSAKMDAAVADFAVADNMKNFLVKNSDRALDNYWYKEGELVTVSPDINEFAFQNAVDAISPVYKSGNTFRAAKILASEMRADSVFVKHILLQNDSESKADSLAGVVNAKNFSDVAVLYSADQSSAADGQVGSIGWMTQSYMIPGMESVLDAEINKPFVLKTQYGTHVVLVTEKTKPVLKKQVAILEKTAIASNETFNTMYAKANKFATIANGSLSNYNAAVDSLGTYSHPLQHVIEGTSTYGAIDNAKEVTRWIFDAKKAGKVSDVITVNQNYFFVVALKDIHKEGLADVNSLASSIRQEIYAEKLAEKTAAKVADQIKGLTTLEEIAEKLGTTVSSQSGVTFASLGSAALDPKFVGAASVAPINQLSAPVAGAIGTYVFMVKGRDNGSFYTEEDAAAYQDRKNQYNAQMLTNVMMDDAEVVDHRARFF